VPKIRVGVRSAAHEATISLQQRNGFAFMKIPLIEAASSAVKGAQLRLYNHGSILSCACRRCGKADDAATHSTPLSPTTIAAMSGISRAISAAALKNSLLLPKTEFPMRANASVRELQHVERLTTTLYRRQAAAKPSDARPFVLHDGPPYANGSLHTGHFMNKVLKDIINRHALVSGRAVDFVPGWDCHGLPIEQKALQSIKASDSTATGGALGAEVEAHRTMEPLEIRRLARSFAEDAINHQRADFQRWGVLADWDVAARQSTGAAYITMDAAYEAEQLRVFAGLLERGFVHRALKPVYWSPSSSTALAEAELEYEERHSSKSAFVAFPFVHGESAAAAAALAESAAPQAGGLSAVVWTTTPWTLPANVALAVHPELEYAVVSAAEPISDAGAATVAGAVQPRFLIQTDRIGELERVLSAQRSSASATPAAASAAAVAALPAPTFQLVRHATLLGRELQGALFRHPLSHVLPSVPELEAAATASHDSSCSGATPSAALQCRVRLSPVICASYVTADSGTGIVHTAPGHGHDDFASCMAYNAQADATGAAAVAAADGSAAAPAPSGSAAPSRPRAPATLPILCPVDAHGCFTAEAGEGLAGLSVLDKGNGAVLKQLQEAGALLGVQNYKHRYPYDWRTRKPVIIRATQQWFVRLAPTFTAECKRALQGVAMTPSNSRNRFESMIGSRAEWCISRQRHWGVPIPALYDAQTGEAVMTPELVHHVAAVFAREGGSDAWWRLPVEAFLPPSMAAEYAGRQLVKGQDTLDVWFDSGSSWAAAWAHAPSPPHPDARAEGGSCTTAASGSAGPAAAGRVASGASGRVADVVLEGSDQHRGWFQSSLITAVAATSGAPYREIITHGFTLDEHGRKMSKSLGNIILPSDIIDGRPPAPAAGAVTSTAVAPAAGSPNGGAAKGGKGDKPKAGGGGKGAAAAKGTAAAPGKGDAGAFGVGHGVDVLRYWVASSDYTRDTTIGPAVMTTITEAVRKIRNTARFLLGNLHDYAPPMPAVAASDAVATRAFFDASDAPNAAAAQDSLARRRPVNLPAADAAALRMWSAAPATFMVTTAGGAACTAGISPDTGRLGVLERCMLHRLAAFSERVEGGYARRDFHQVAAAVNEFVSVDLSSQYFDFCKDRLYADAPASAFASQPGAASPPRSTDGSRQLVLGKKRRAAQAVLWEILRQLTRTLAPIMPYTAEEIYQHSARIAAVAAGAGVRGGSTAVTAPDGASSVDVALPHSTVFDVDWQHCAAASPRLQAWKSPQADAQWTTLLHLRAEVNRCLEAVRTAKRIGSALEASVVLTVQHGGELALLLAELQGNDELEDLFLTSSVQVKVATQPINSTTDRAPFSSSGAGAAASPSLVQQEGGGFSCSAEAEIQVFLPAAAAVGPPSGSPSTVGSAVDGREAIHIEVVPADGHKCARCWKVKPEAASHPSRLCTRCDTVITDAGLWGQ
jgi:isoleucyl-tRNA synthetase